MNWFLSNPVVGYDSQGNVIMDRHLRQHGLKMQGWHRSQGDPIYAVGSYHFAGKLHPQRDVVERALSGLESLRDNARTAKLRNELRRIIWDMHKYYPYLSSGQ